MAEHNCGPTGDTDFFEALGAVFDKFPDAAKNYSISCIDHETDIMKIDFKKQTALARIEGNRVITEYRDTENFAASGLICCKWWRESDSTWTCLQRWDHADAPDTSIPTKIFEG